MGFIKSKPDKYAVYIIGEILLVMIDILLAIPVNNQNEARIARNAEAQFYQNFKRSASNKSDYSL